MEYKELKHLFKNVLTRGGFEPRKDKIFKVFQTHPEDIKVVILGKSPYCNYNMATGLAFQNGWENLDESLSKSVSKKDIIPILH